MRVCFIHQNLPAQYRHLISALLKRGYHVLAIGKHGAIQRWPMRHPNLGTLGYRLPDAAAQDAVPAHLRLIDLQVARARAVLRALLKAMAAGCCIVGSDTPPVREVIDDGVQGQLVDFFDTDMLAQGLAKALARPADTQALREAARRTVRERFDLQRICLPAGLAMLDNAAQRP